MKSIFMKALKLAANTMNVAGVAAWNYEFPFVVGSKLPYYFELKQYQYHLLSHLKMWFLQS